jgi:anti-sigma factor RsiW
MTSGPSDPVLLVHAYVDGELDPAHALEVERLMAADPALAAERDRIEALRRAIGERLPREAVPPGLAARIEAAAGLNARRLAPSSSPSWRALAASILVVAVLASGATWLVLRPTQGDAVADFVVASHMRGLLASQPFDVASSDRHTVKPWFNGRVPQAPRVVDLAQAGFPLAGGRVDVIGREPVATLIYRHGPHLISLFEIPASATSGEMHRMIAGYNVVSWSENGVAYWAVSDVEATELAAFAKAFRDAKADG